MHLLSLRSFWWCWTELQYLQSCFWFNYDFSNKQNVIYSFLTLSTNTNCTSSEKMAELLYWFASDCRGVPNKVAAERKYLCLELEDAVNQSFVLLHQSRRFSLLHLQRWKHRVTVWTLGQTYEGGATEKNMECVSLCGHPLLWWGPLSPNTFGHAVCCSTANRRVSKVKSVWSFSSYLSDSVTSAPAKPSPSLTPPPPPPVSSSLPPVPSSSPPSPSAPWWFLLSCRFLLGASRSPPPEPLKRGKMKWNKGSAVLTHIPSPPSPPLTSLLCWSPLLLILQSFTLAFPALLLLLLPSCLPQTAAGLLKPQQLWPDRLHQDPLKDRKCPQNYRRRLQNLCRRFLRGDSC